MAAPLSIAANLNDFEFEALKEARNYRQALFQEFSEALKGRVLEVGSGVGQMTEHLAGLAGVNQVVSVEPDPEHCREHRAKFPEHIVIEGTAAEVRPGTEWDAILSVNVLEHIREDEAELARYAELLRPRAGCLCLFVPARPEIYAPIDADFGHYRRYRRAELAAKLVRAGFQVQRLNYFNATGYVAWWVNFCLLKKRSFDRAKVRFYDRVIFPMVHALESRLVRPPIGQSLIAEAKAQGLTTDRHG